MIGLLAETLGIFVPNIDTLEMHLKEKTPEDHKKLVDYYKNENPLIELPIIEELLEFNKMQKDEIVLNSQRKENELYKGTTRLDQMKINSLEIIISFYQSAHIPMPDINKFVLG